MNILVTGGSGLVGQALQRLRGSSRHTFHFPTSSELNLLSKKSIAKYMEKAPTFDFIIHLAANVGGLYRNLRSKVSMFRDNIRINENVLEMCIEYNIRMGIFMLSTCIFPDKPKEYPLTEDNIFDGPPHSSCASYAHAKRMLYFNCQNYNKEYNTNFVCLTPCNVYGPGDSFHNRNAHVIPSLISKFSNAERDKTKLQLQTGYESRRQFIYVDDLAQFILSYIDRVEFDNVIITGDEISTVELIQLIASYFPKVEYTIIDKEDGQIRKTCKSNVIDYTPPTRIEEGIKRTIEWYRKPYSTLLKPSHDCPN